LKRVALFTALALLLSAVACKGNTTHHTFKTTTPPSTSTSTTTPSTTTSAKAVVAPAPPNGTDGHCDASALARAEPRADRTKYVIDAALDLANNQVTGTLQAVFTPDKDTDHVVLRLWPNGPTPAGKGAHEDIANVTIDGKSVAFHMDNPTTAYVDTTDKKSLTPNKAITIKLSFTLRLPGVSDDRLSRQGNIVRLGSWLPLLAWEPGVAWDIEPPTTSNAEASVTVASDFDVHFVVPAGLTVLATGVSDGPFHWTAKAVGDWAASVGSFNLAEGEAAGAKVTVGVEKSMSESPTPYLARVTAALTDLSRRYGPYAYPTFTLALTPNLKGGIEYPGHVMQGPNTNARTTPHEVAHQWFYSLVGNDQGRDPWLDEGMASWAEAQTNHTYASFVSRPIPADGRNQIGQPMTYWDPRHGSYYSSVYVQSVQALAAMGQSTAAIDCALARYVAANAYRVATPIALASALKTVAPNAVEVLARYGAQRIT
jgi:peptidase M1-like protein